MRYNIAICGLPRSGKTTKAKQLFAKFTQTGTAIFVNSQFEDYFSQYPTAYDLKNLYDAIRKYKKVVFNPIDNNDLLKLIDKLFENQKKSKLMQPFRLIIDEIQLYQDIPGAKQILTKCAVDGLKWNIQTVITAHFPTMVHSHIYKNCHLYYFFKLNPPIYTALKREWHIDLFQYQDFLNHDFNYVMYDSNKFYPHSAAGIPAVSDDSTETGDTDEITEAVDNPAADHIETKKPDVPK